MPKIKDKYRGKIDIQYLNIENIKNYKLLLSYEKKYGKAKRILLPVVFLEGVLISGETKIRNNLEAAIGDSLKKEHAIEKELPHVDLLSKFKSFSIIAIIFAGLIDGINPCAFSVIVFFITFLTFQKYKKKEVVVTSLSFIFAVFLAYLLLGLGLFRIFYSLKLFYFISKIIYILIAIIAFILGMFAIYDIVKFKKTGQTQDLVLKLPERIKYYIHRLIGWEFRKDSPGNAKTIYGLIISAILAGIIVSVLEAVCTGQVYLPTITFVLKTFDLKAQALIYLVIYNLMFIVPLMLVFLFALFGTSSQQFSLFMRKHIITIKILMATLFFGLGLILIWNV